MLDGSQISEHRRDSTYSSMKSNKREWIRLIGNTCTAGVWVQHPGNVSSSLTETMIGESWLVGASLLWISSRSVVCSPPSLHAALPCSAAICFIRSLCHSQTRSSLTKALHQLTVTLSQPLSPLAIIKHFPKICCHIALAASSPLSHNCSQTKVKSGWGSVELEPLCKLLRTLSQHGGAENSSRLQVK